MQSISPAEFPENVLPAAVLRDPGRLSPQSILPAAANADPMLHTEAPIADLVRYPEDPDRLPLFGQGLVAWGGFGAPSNGVVVVPRKIPIEHRAAVRYYSAWPEIYAQLDQPEPLDSEKPPTAKAKLIDELFGGWIPIAQLEDAKAIAEMTDEQLREIVPVSAVPLQIPTIDDDKKPKFHGIEIKIGSFRDRIFVEEVRANPNASLIDLFRVLENDPAKVPSAWHGEAREVWLRFSRAYWDAHQNGTLQAYIGASRRRPLVKPGLGPDSSVRYPTNIVSQAAFGFIVEATEDKQALRRSAEGYPMYDLRQKQGNVTVELRPDLPLGVGAQDVQTVYDQILARIDERDFDTWIIMLAHWAVHRDEDGGVWIDRKKILESRGLEQKKKKQAGFEYRAGIRERDLAIVGDSVSRISALWFTFSDMEVSDERGRRSRIGFSSRSFTVSEYFWQDTLDGQTRVAEAWYYRPGKWASQIPTTSQYINIQRTILKLDPYRDRWAKRLAFHFAFLMRINKGTYVRRVGDLLAELRLSTPDHPERERPYFTKALQRLADGGDIGAWHYKGVSDLRELERTLSKRGGYEKWKSLEVCIEPTPEQLDSLRQIASKARRRPHLAGSRR